MLTYTTRRNLAGQLCSDSSSANLTILDTLLNEADREIITAKPWPFRQSSITLSTVASQQFYNVPSATSMNDVTVTIGTTSYTPTIIRTREDWDQINMSTSVTSDIPQYAFFYNGQVGFYPTPASSTASAIEISFMKGQKDLTVADYATGSIVSVANGGTAVVGTGTSWTAQMAGRYIRITDSNTVNTGDGLWYLISSVGSTTTLTLQSAYQGSAISAGSASYTIGQVSIIPEEFQMVSVHRTVQKYFTFLQPEPVRAKQAGDMFAFDMKRMQAELGGVTL